MTSKLKIAEKIRNELELMANSSFANTSKNNTLDITSNGRIIECNIGGVKANIKICEETDKFSYHTHGIVSNYNGTQSFMCITDKFIFAFDSLSKNEYIPIDDNVKIFYIEDSSPNHMFMVVNYETGGIIIRGCKNNTQTLTDFVSDLKTDGINFGYCVSMFSFDNDGIREIGNIVRKNNIKHVSFVDNKSIIIIPESGVLIKLNIQNGGTIILPNNKISPTNSYDIIDNNLYIYSNNLYLVSLNDMEYITGIEVDKDGYYSFVYSIDDKMFIIRININEESDMYVNISPIIINNNDMHESISVLIQYKGDTKQIYDVINSMV